jgi:hypothetical protein
MLDEARLDKTKMLRTALIQQVKVQPRWTGLDDAGHYLGGRSGIRTHEGAEPPAGFQDQCLKPLGHPSPEFQAVPAAGPESWPESPAQVRDPCLRPTHGSKSRAGGNALAPTEAAAL